MNNPFTLADLLQYAERGLPVFPCRTKEKIPLTRNGFHGASVDIEKLQRWIQQFPNANYGVPTGEGAGVWVLDVDARHNGMESLSELTSTHGELPTTWVATTGGGGKHFYFRYPQSGCINNTTSLAGLAGVDVRGMGGYVVVPPSATEGVYSWDASPWDTDLAEAPEFLINLALTRSRVDNKFHDGQTHWTVELARGVGEGNRNEAATRLSGYLFSSSIDPELTIELMRAWNRRNSPPLEDEELERTLQSIAQREYEQRTNLMWGNDL